MPNLRELTQDIIELSDLIDGMHGEPDEEVTAAIEEQIGFLKDDIEGKAESIVHLILEKEAVYESQMKEAERIRKMAVKNQRTAQRLHDWLHWNLKQLGTRRIETNTVELSIKNVGGKQRLEVDESQLPEEYTSKRISIVPDRKKIQAAHDEGVEVPGVKVCERGTKLNY